MSTPACAWPSCEHKHHARGLCSAHYKRVQDHIRKHSAPWPATPTLMANVLRACGAWTVTEPRCLWRRVYPQTVLAGTVRSGLPALAPVPAGPQAR